VVIMVAHPDGVSVVVGRARLRGEFWLSLVLLVLPAAGLVAGIKFIIAPQVDAPRLQGVGLIAGAVLAAWFLATRSALCQSLVVDDDGVRWRTSPWSTGHIRWELISRADTQEKSRNWINGGGMMTVGDPRIVLTDGAVVDVGRSRSRIAFWTPQEMIEFTEAVSAGRTRFEGIGR
jgi:hypothetical protein